MPEKISLFCLTGKEFFIKFIIMNKLFTVLILFFLLSLKVCAHPHVWIETSLDFYLENKKITHINVEWAYDEFYSSAYFFEADKNNDKNLNLEEKIENLDATYEELKKNNYFINLKINDKKFDNYKIKNFNTLFKDEIFKVKYTILPENPLDPFNEQITTSFYDKSYFIEIYFNENSPVNFNGIRSCEYKLYEDMTETYYYGMVNPETIKVICK